VAVSNYESFAVTIVNPANGDLLHSFFLEDTLNSPGEAFADITGLDVKLSDSDNVIIVAKSDDYYMLIKFNV